VIYPDLNYSDLWTILGAGSQERRLEKQVQSPCNPTEHKNVKPSRRLPTNLLQDKENNYVLLLTPVV
jgi:hypothetical protein